MILHRNKKKVLSFNIHSYLVLFVIPVQYYILLHNKLTTCDLTVYIFACNNNNHYHYLTLCKFFTLVLTGVFHLSLSDCKPFQVSRTLQSILADFNNVMIHVVLTHPLISCFFNLFSEPFGTIFSVSAIIDITVINIFLSFLNPLARSKYLPRFLFSFIFILWSAGQITSSFPLVNQNYIWPFDQDWLICLYLKVSGLLCFIF